MNMKKIRSLLLLAVLSTAALSQEPLAEPVTWTASAEPVKTSGGERLYRLRIDGRIAPGYIVYGSDFKVELGPNPTRLRFAADSGITARGALESTGTHQGKDPSFKVDYTYFEGRARLAQLVAVAAGTPVIVGTIVGQTCREADGTCTLFRARLETRLPEKP